MGKMSQLDMLLKEAREAIQAAENAINDLTSMLSGNVSDDAFTVDPYDIPDDPKPVKEPSKVYTFEEVRGLLAEKARGGHNAEVRAVLKMFNATKLSEVNPDDYEALILEAQAIGIDA